jgi:hypothetical protein
MSDNLRFSAEFGIGREGLSVVIEDDGNVCYGYLWEGDVATADVWLYNCRETPDSPPWKMPNARDNMPFMNPLQYVVPPSFVIPTSADDFRAAARFSKGELAGVEIFLGDEHIATLVPGCKPSFSLLARVAGPLARPLSAKSSGTNWSSDYRFPVCESIEKKYNSANSSSSPRPPFLMPLTAKFDEKQRDSDPKCFKKVG